MKIALLRFPLNVLNSKGLAKLLRTLLLEKLAEREAEITNLIGHRQKITMLERDAELDNVPGVSKELCCVSML